MLQNGAVGPISAAKTTRHRKKVIHFYMFYSDKYWGGCLICYWKFKKELKIFFDFFFFVSGCSTRFFITFPFPCGWTERDAIALHLLITFVDGDRMGLFLLHSSSRLTVQQANIIQKSAVFGRKYTTIFLEG